ncbi:GerMN domain-containing protein [Dethiobacter alkaliphilus]|uniref:GerMN domain-containing protein n=1 Tax=Dethiobacter alkaliphilus TaxID=427926 RepID=UPI00222770EC|nr:GerMN domain-containing protein [Dethiobacter alkaliphilus]MCW3490040.1 GerMN domain-containing protein [Dethiobacter alkaliphilus]
MKKIFAVSVVLLLLLLWAVGCTSNTQPQQSPQNTATMQEEGEELMVTLYYADSELMGLVTEEREITVPPGEDAILLALRELIKEPQEPDSVVLMPLETEVLWIDAAENIITINFNENIRDNFYGGSSSEALLVASIVNTVTGFAGYQDYKVRFLINGEPFDSIGGHLSAEELFERQQ